MEISHLSSFGVPEPIVKLWCDKVGHRLLPVQSRAVREFGLLDGHSLLVSAPTSSGKTFCGELAAATAIFRRRKAIFLVPLKALAEEKYADFTAKYSPLGVRVVVSTRDHRKHDRSIERGEFDLGVLVYEKFNQLLIKNIDLLKSIDLIVIDEVQMLADKDRGLTLELALLKVLLSEFSPQVVALSAALPDTQKLADWLKCRLLEDHHRPVELHQGVLVGGHYRYRAFNTGVEGSEQLVESMPDDPAEVLVAMVEHLVRTGEQILVFLRSKRDCERLAWKLADHAVHPAAEETINRVKAQPCSLLVESLCQTLASGVAFHHADLSHRQRQILEQAFRTGDIRVLVSTTTLALGVNLPAQTVFVDCCKYELGQHSGRALAVPLSWSEYEAMSGRAGRLCGEKSYGRSIVIAAGELEAQAIWENYIIGSPGALESSFDIEQLTDGILDLVASGAVKYSGSLPASLARGYPSRSDREFKEQDIDDALALLIRERLLADNNGQLVATAIGGEIRRKGIPVETATQMLDQLADYGGSDRLSWLFLAAATPAGRETPIYLSYQQAEQHYYQHRLREYLFDAEGVSDKLRAIVERDNPTDDESLRSLKCAFLLLDWLTEATTRELELSHQVRVGAILQAAEKISWIIEVYASLAAILNKPEAQSSRLTVLARAVGCGYDLPDTVVSEIGLRPEQRDLAWALNRAGFLSVRDFCDSKRGRLAAILGVEWADRLISKFTESDDKQKEVSEMARLKVSNRQRGNRVVLQFGGSEIEISPKSFNYLFKLAAARFLKPEGWLDKEEIEPGFNQAKNIYRVKQELKRSRTGLEQRIENNKSGLYRINLSPEQIAIDFDSMADCSDLELAALARRVQESKVLTN
jgi:replicative superfamily II helicase